MILLMICGSNENDITEKLKKIIHANAAMQDESVESYEV
jgi:hypothetical protein